MRSLLLMIALFTTVAAFSQGQNAPSPAATATGKIKAATITIKYSSPAVKGRKIWGDLVPYGKVWRTGANQATIFETDKDIKVEGKTLAAGKYSLYTIPNENEWIIIFNSATGQWGIKGGGATTQEDAKDVLRVTVKPKKSSSFNERMLFNVTKKGVTLLWENLEVPIKIK